jgi:hypothetical protein
LRGIDDISAHDDPRGPWLVRSQLAPSLSGIEAASGDFE